MESRIYSLLRFLPFIRLIYEEGGTANEGEKFPDYFHAGRPNGFGRGLPLRLVG